MSLVDQVNALATRIATEIKGLRTTTVPVAPAVTASVGTSTSLARSDHVHPLAIATVSADTPASGFPYGYSLMNTSGDSTWPTGAVPGMVVTERLSGQRCIQHWYPKTNPQLGMIRSETAGDVWGAWASFPKGDTGPQGPRGVADDALPTGAIRVSTDRRVVATNQTALTSGQPRMVAIQLQAGDIITSITFVTGTTAPASPTHQWFALYDSSRNLVRVTGDDTNAAWASSSPKTLNLSSSYTVPSTGMYYLGILVTATTMPTLFATNGASQMVGVTVLPILCGNSSSAGLTTPATAPATAGALATSIGVPLAYVGGTAAVDDNLAPVVATFSAQGTLAAFTGTQRYYVTGAGTLTLSKAALGTAGSTDTTILVKKNGATAHTVTVAAGANLGTAAATVTVAVDDYLTVDVSVAGTGAADLTVQVRIIE